jgi:catechol 2,3-dioxygenase-like lactoylglutathione lyase family enzyme
MALDALDHYTIQCEDLATTRDFYCDGLGLEDGPRPDLGIPGHWLYCGGAPVVHLMALRGGAPAAETGAFDHIAFRGTDANAMIARLKSHKIDFRENRIADFGLHQVFVHDPNGIMVEMNFRG